MIVETDDGLTGYGEAKGTPVVMKVLVEDDRRRPTTRQRSPRSTAASMDCRSLSSSPPRACGSSRRRRSWRDCGPAAADWHC